MSTIRLESTPFERNPYVIKFSRGEIPGDKDIAAIKLIGAEGDKIEKVEIQMGPRNTGVLVYTGSDIHNLPLPEGGILFSRTSYIETYLTIYFKREYLESQRVYGDYVNEYQTVEEVSDELVEIKGLDGEYYEGYVVTRKREPTGHKYRESWGYKDIGIPEIEITLCDPVHGEPGQTVQTPFWEKVKESSFSPERLAILKEEGKYKDGKFLNTMRYMSGMAGKLYLTDLAD
jgi:hypothetical protein